MIEHEILMESQAFSVVNKERHFQIETIFNWNEMTIGDIMVINKTNFNGLFEQWMKNLCKKRSCHHQDIIEQTANVEKPTDVVLLNETETNSIQQESSSYEYRSSIDETELEKETYSPLNDELSSPSLDIEQTENLSHDNYTVYNDESIILNSLITDILNDRLTTETLAETNNLLPDKSNQRSLLKHDKTTSIHSLFSEKTNIFSDFFTDLFIVEKNTSKSHNLGRHEHWIANAYASYTHPFNDYSHQPCPFSIDNK